MNTSTGFMEATSLGGGITGYGSAIILIDDVENPVEMYSKAYNAEVKNYLDHVLPSRLNDHATGSIIAVQQRLHADDASAHLIKKGWKHVSIPAIATDDATYGTYERKAGEVLWSRTSEDILAQLKSDMGIVAFEAQYQQNPSSPDAQLIDWDKMVFGEIPNAFVAGRRKIISIDTTFTKSINSDYTGIIVMEALDTAGGRKYYIHKVINTKISYGELKELVHVLYKEYQPHTVLVELAANGHVLLEELRKLGIPVEGITPRTSKIARFNAVYEKLYDCIFSVPCNGNILLDQLKAFPYSKHDDMVDALVHGLTYFRTLRLKP
jgi:predicted phage terminase large subunit-like protein